MTRLRLLAWLLSLAALIAPPGLLTCVAQASAAPVEHAPAVGHAVAVGCADHLPAPPPCPDEGSARHAAGTCCPAMAGVAMLPPPGLEVVPAASLARPDAPLARMLHGRGLQTEPPPPRA